MKLENTVVIVADLGEIKVFEIVEHKGIVGSEEKSSYSLDLVLSENIISGRKKLGEMQSDRSGNFVEGTLENHNLKTEKERNTIKDISEDIEMIVKELKPTQVFLSFPKEHNQELSEILGSETKSVLAKNIAADLVKTNKEKILSYFA